MHPEFDWKAMEKAGFHGFPALVETIDDEAVWRASGGFNFRNSSVTLLDVPREPLSTFLDRVETFCITNGIEPVLRLPAPVGIAADELKALGWQDFRRAIVVWRGQQKPGAGLKDSALQSTDLEDWLAAQRAAKNQNPRDSEKFDAVLQQIESGALPFLWNEGGEIQGSALLIDAQGMLALMNMLVSPAARGRGVGRRLLAALLDFADARDQPVWLQVFEGNAPARALYASAGFKKAYDYTYWRKTASR